MNMDCKDIKVGYEGYANSIGIGICYSREAADEYKLKHGGIIFKEQGQEIYRIFPNKVNTTIYYMEEQ
jgi:hypothetical protein